MQQLSCFSCMCNHSLSQHLDHDPHPAPEASTTAAPCLGCPTPQPFRRHTLAFTPRGQRSPRVPVQPPRFPGRETSGGMRNHPTHAAESRALPPATGAAPRGASTSPPPAVPLRQRHQAAEAKQGSGVALGVERVQRLPEWGLAI